MSMIYPQYHCISCEAGPDIEPCGNWQIESPLSQEDKRTEGISYIYINMYM